jgi:signal peptidase II
MRNFYLTASLVFILDRLTKHLVLLADYHRIELLPFLALVKVWNRGVAFGLFSSADAANLFFALATALALVVVLYLSRRADIMARLGYGLIFGGGLANLVDRVVFGGVLDFIDLHVGGLHWPAFNVADLTITIGVIVLLFAYSKKKA